MSVLVTGASGFLGRRLAQILRERGEAVHLLVRPSSILDAHDLALGQVHRCSLADIPGLTAILQSVRVVFHCAALSSDWGPWSEFRAANIDGVVNLLRASLAAGSVERFVHVSSTDVYGYPARPGDESMALRDVGLPYNRSKCAGDHAALDFHRRTGLPVTIVRPATIFGPGSKDWVVELGRHLVARRAVTIAGGRTPAGLVYVDDVARVMIALSENPQAIGEAYNVVDPTAVTWRMYIDTIADAFEAPRVRLNIDRRTALTLSYAGEMAYRILRMKTRPMLTRHAVLLLTRDQQFSAARLTRLVPAFPYVGVKAGLDVTSDWIRSTITR
ncbi:MAG: NAD-dependent epimerase/dehydratase family protein [Alphaproteobacteria bacterium]